jgi:hypothetical protein
MVINKKLIPPMYWLNEWLQALINGCDVNKIFFPKLLRLIFQAKICQKKRPLKRGSIHYTYEIFYIYRIRKM